MTPKESKEYQNLIKENIKVAEKNGDFERANFLKQTFEKLLEIELN